jgi:Kef-type K+ transport system membrane component KefB
VTREVILTLSLLLGAALAARFVASLLKVPEMIVLVAVGVLLGGSALDVAARRASQNSCRYRSTSH